MANFVALDLLFMLPGAGRTSPSISPTWFGEERGCDACHVKEVLTPVTLYGFGAAERK